MFEMNVAQEIYNWESRRMFPAIAYAWLSYDAAINYETIFINYHFSENEKWEVIFEFSSGTFG